MLRFTGRWHAGLLFFPDCYRFGDLGDPKNVLYRLESPAFPERVDSFVVLPRGVCREKLGRGRFLPVKACYINLIGRYKLLLFVPDVE